MNAENPHSASISGSSRISAANQGNATPLAGNSIPVRVATLPTTSTYRTPPWSWMVSRGGMSDQLVPLAALAVILAALVAMGGIVAMVAILVLKAT